jgi:hypothetical protein
VIDPAAHIAKSNLGLELQGLLRPLITAMSCGLSALNAGFISGSPRYNYGKENFKIP